MISWKKYQSEIATDEEIIKWVESDCQIGVVTGSISNLCVIDVEADAKPEDYDNIPDNTLMQKSGGGGVHYFFQNAPELKNVVRAGGKKVDLRAEGGFIVVAPSVSEKGGYKWLNSNEPQLFPESLKSFFRSADSQEHWVTSNNIDYVGQTEGSRNDALAKYLGKLLFKIDPLEWETKAFNMLREANDKNMPPLSETEITRIFNSIKERESRKQAKKTKEQVGEKLVNFLLNSNIKLFRDQFGEAYAAINGNGAKIMKLDSGDFFDYINQIAFKNKINCGQSAIDQAISLLRGKTMEENNKRELNLRAAQLDSNYWYDLGNEKVVKINALGWELLTDYPIVFKRFKHQLAQSEPKNMGLTLDNFLGLVNIKESDDVILLKVYIICCFISGFAHPVIIVHGPQGSAKSTLFSLLKSLVDPSKLETLPPIRDLKEFTQVLSHHWASLFDNLSALSDDLSDHMCRACSGGGLSKRKFYTDDDDVIYNMQHLIGLNGINNVAMKADLLDRSILIGLDRISDEHRKTDADIKERFNKIKPGLLSYIFDIISRAISLKENSLKLDIKLNRMADFTLWGYYIADALEIGGEKFLEAYKNNIDRQNEEALACSSVAEAIIYMTEQSEYGVISGTPREIFGQMKAVAEKLGIDTITDKTWPKSGSWVIRRIKTILPNLEKVGLKVETGMLKQRYIKITNVNVLPKNNPEEVVF